MFQPCQTVNLCVLEQRCPPVSRASERRLVGPRGSGSAKCDDADCHYIILFLNTNNIKLQIFPVSVITQTI